jgi:hypothetical protein
MFWIGFVAGLFIGANLGLLIMGILIAARDEKAHPCNRRRGEEAL